ncbi:MAG: hypothetical protein DHS20C04_05690 [Hyphococcus sp.]|nr:MAG: hypothetical protein DHS20C04_05690 [Marinicaulis sp.]
MAHGLPSMGELQDHLVATIKADNTEEEAWLLVRTALSQGDHLEQALAATALPKTLITKVVGETWRCVSKKDKELFNLTLLGKIEYPIAALMKALFQSSNVEINIVTTNYDRVIEYACGSVGLITSSGFIPGYLQLRDAPEKIKFFRESKPLRNVKLWKVHGSLDWFERQDGSVFGAPLFDNMPAEISPLIVTPGVSKFERTYDEPFRSSIQGADIAIAKAEGILCVGYGFRDTHIEPKIVERCKEKNIPITVLAKSLTGEAKDFLQNKSGKNYLAFEDNATGTIAYSQECPNGIELPNVALWSLDGFLKLVQ